MSHGVKEMRILRVTERAMVRSMCGVKLVDRKNMEELMEMLGLKEALDRMAKANEVRWYGHVIRRDDNNIIAYLILFAKHLTDHFVQNWFYCRIL